MSGTLPAFRWMSEKPDAKGHLVEHRFSLKKGAPITIVDTQGEVDSPYHRVKVRTQDGVVEVEAKLVRKGWILG